ncbi:MAG: phosphoenolpyruvate--protein phosphotransferase [Polyangiales bacterium]
MTRAFAGIIASTGTASAPVHMRQAVEHVVRRSVTNAAAEQTRLRSAIERSRRELEAAAVDLRKSGSEAALVFDAHLLMHGDAMLVDAALALIEEDKVCAEWAVRATVRTIKAPLESSSSAYLRERATDIEQVGNHIVRELRGERSPQPTTRCVVVADELSPAFAMELMANKSDKHVVGVVTEGGSASSHTAILAAALGVPALVGVSGITKATRHGQEVLVDALRGQVVIEPSVQEKSEALERRRAHQLFSDALFARIGEPARTLDGVDVSVAANIELPEEASAAAESGAAGVGLYRTEFLFLARDTLPSEEEQFLAYRSVLAGADARVVFRALDIGGDKLPRSERLQVGPNPALGLRSIRLLLRRPKLLRTQVRGILRAATLGPASLMFPLVTSVEDLQAAKALVASFREELEAEGVRCGPLPIGAMVEVPAAALQVSALCAEAAFLSVGTNDLVQYTLAADRGNPDMAKSASALHPAVIRLLALVAEESTVPVSVCGEMAGDPLAMPLLLGLGYRSLSVPPLRVPLVAEVVRRSEMSVLERIATECRAAATTEGVRAHLRGQLRASLGELWSGANLLSGND